MDYNEIEGDLIKLALEGKFDVIAHGCNCFCQMGAGLAPQMAKAFGCDLFQWEHDQYKGEINKLGMIDYELRRIDCLRRVPVPQMEGFIKGKNFYVVNCYSQYRYGRNHSDGEQKPLDYAALELCFKKINHDFKGKHIGLPQIGCHLAGGDWNIVKTMIQTHLRDCIITVVIYKP